MDAGPVNAIGHPHGVPVPRIALAGGRRVRSLAAPVASLLVALTAIGAGPRVFTLVALPALAAGALEHRLPRAVAAGIGVLLGVLALGAGSIADRPALLLASVLWLLAGIGRAWGINRGRPRRRAWTNRSLTALGA